MRCKLCQLIPVSNQEFQLPEFVLAQVARNYNKHEIVSLFIWYSLTYVSPTIDMRKIKREAVLKMSSDISDPEFVVITELNRMIDSNDFKAFDSVATAQKMVKSGVISLVTFLAIWHQSLSKSDKYHRRLSRYCEILECVDKILTDQHRQKINELRSNTKKTKRSSSTNGVGCKGKERVHTRSKKLVSEVK